MSERPTRISVLRTAIVLTALFDLLALLVLARGTPVVFTVFMFLGQPLCAVAWILILAAVLADLKAKQLFWLARRPPRQTGADPESLARVDLSSPSWRGVRGTGQSRSPPFGND